MTWVAIVFFLAVVVLSGLNAGFMPLLNDDLSYACRYSCVKHRFCPENDFDILDMMICQRDKINGRFGDMFTPVFVLIPNLIYGILYGCCYGGILLMMNRIARISLSKDPKKVIWLTALTVIFFPWFDDLFSRAVFLNYFPSALMLLYVIKKFISRRQLKGWKSGFCVAMAFLVSWWHELVPVSMIPAAIVFCVITRNITRNQFIIGIGVIAGLLMALSAPSFFHRTDQLAGVILSYYVKTPFVAYILCSLVLSILTIVLFYRKKESIHNKAILWSFLTPLVPISILDSLSLFECRMFLYSTMLILTVLVMYFPSMRGNMKRVSLWITISVCGLVVIHLSSLVMNTRKVFIASEEILKQARSDTDKNIYYDLSTLLETPEYTYLYKSVAIPYITQFSHPYFKLYTERNRFSEPIHPAFRSFDSSKARRLEAPEEIYCVDSQLAVVSPFDETPECIYGSAVIEYIDGEILRSDFAGYAFQDIDGKDFVYLLFTNPIRKRNDPKRIIDFYINK